MTTGHAPHTPPMWRRVISLPRTRLGWLSVVLIGVPVALFFLGVIVYEEKWIEVPGWVEPLLSQYISMALSLLAGAVVGLLALLRSQERSVLVWLAMVAGLPAFLPLGFLGLVLKDTLALETSTLPLITAVVVLITVLISVLIAWLQRHKSGKPR